MQLVLMMLYHKKGPGRSKAIRVGFIWKLEPSKTKRFLNSRSFSVKRTSKPHQSKNLGSVGQNLPAAYIPMDKRSMIELKICF